MDVLRERFLQDWQAWADDLSVTSDEPEFARLAHISAAVLRMHEDRTYPGGLVASLSVPWGNSTDSLGGYHLVWPRDAVLSAFAQITCGELEDARRVLDRLIATQEWDGHWAQNEYPSGEPYWNGLQLDQTALPVLLAAKLQELGQPEPCGLQGSMRRALAFLARTGPTSEQDRWEENPGVNPFTVAVSIAALIAGSPWLSGDERGYALALAADWNERLEHWCYVEGTPLAEQHGVDGYYIRLAPPQEDGVRQGEVLLRNRWGQTIEAAALVSLDFTYLARLGLRDVHDPRIQNTLTVVDQVLRRTTPSGEWLYYRYNSDGYGEQEDGSPYDENGVGRLWPLLTGERGQLAQLAGEDVTPFLRTMLNCASPGGLLPEQVWDGKAIPERGLYPGKATGSATPLSWSHAEFLKLLVASQTGAPPSASSR
ncbi:glycoside hydrolase family 15 protein [Deinococcus radiophilus]|uniref:glycoside hydrolase family 15 protein n=1 Tax=Deinococcus radiophilus TaxID=32062 RepID=UPI0036227CE4